MKRRLIALGVVVMLGLSVAVPFAVSVQGEGPQYSCHYAMALDGNLVSESDFVSATDATNTVQRGPSVVTVTCNEE